MTMYMRDYTGDVLSITDEQVAADWRMGMTRAAGRAIRYGIAPSDSTGSFGITIAGSNREHIRGGGGVRNCKVVEIFNIKEEGGEEHHFSTYGGSTSNVLTLSCLASCDCGRLVKHPMSMNVSPDEFIYMVMNADND